MASEHSNSLVVAQVQAQRTSSSLQLKPMRQRPPLPAGEAQDRSDNEFANMPLAQRDPFKPAILPSEGTASSPKPPAPRPTSNNNYGGVVNPMPVPGPMVGSLPDLQNPGENTGTAASYRPPTTSMKLSGVVIGGHQIALIQTESGKQRTVRVGDTIGGQKVVSISRRGVVLEGQGQRSTLTLEDNAEN